MATVKKRAPIRKDPYRRISEAAIAYLLYGTEPGPGMPGSWEVYSLKFDDLNEKGILHQMWRQHGAKLLESFVCSNPGKRPLAWWRLQSAGPRLKVCGTGKTMADEYPAWVPHYTFGIPDSWHEIDEENPPYFESEAAYLKRLKLLPSAEAKKLTEKDFMAQNINEILGNQESDNEENT